MGNSPDHSGSSSASSIEKARQRKDAPFFLWRHLNKLRWLSLSIVFVMLILIPLFSIYQTYIAAHAYDLLFPNEKMLYDTVEMITEPFISDPETQLDLVKGNTWSGTLFGYKLTDPLAIISQIAASKSIYWPFVLTGLIPLIFTLLFGRFYCGWICPASFLYELNSTVGLWLEKAGLKIGKRHFNKNIKYVILAMGLVLSMITSAVMASIIYPPAILGREIYYAIALSGFGTGIIFFVGTLLFDLLVSRRGFCRYLCPGGALYSLLGRYRLFRIKRIVEHCNDCAKCNAVCEFGLDPLRDHFGQECNNCSACIAVCPTDAMTFVVSIKDYPEQGPGHLGKKYRREHTESVND